MLSINCFSYSAIGVCDRPCSATEECLEVSGKYQCTCRSGFARLGEICLGSWKYHFIQQLLTSWWLNERLSNRRTD